MSMIECPNCKMKISDAANFCPRCATKIEPKPPMKKEGDLDVVLVSMEMTCEPLTVRFFLRNYLHISSLEIDDFLWNLPRKIFENVSEEFAKKIKRELLHCDVRVIPHNTEFYKPSEIVPRFKQDRSFFVCPNCGYKVAKTKSGFFDRKKNCFHYCKECGYSWQTLVD